MPFPPPPPNESPRTIPDPGSPGMALIALVSLLALIAGTFVLQQIKTAPQAQAAVQPVPDDAGNPFVLSSKLAVKMGRALINANANANGKPPAMDTLIEQTTASAKNVEELFRAAAVVGELEGPARAVDHLLRLADFLNTPTNKEINGRPIPQPAEPDRLELLRDIEIAQNAYELGGASTPTADADRLHQRHGWFGKLITTSGLTDESPAREPLVKGGMSLFVLIIAAACGTVLVLLAGFASFIIALVRVLGRGLPRRFIPPAPGGSVYIETAALFFASFLVLKLGLAAAIPAFNLGETQSLQLALSAQWLILPVIFWPIVRGVPAREHFQRLGLHTGQGVFSEIAAGIFGYLAGIPILLLAILVTAVLVIVRSISSGAGPGGSAPVPPPENPVIDIVLQGGITTVMMYALATIWAPLVEESVFRGAMFRHLRARLPLVVAAVISALAFGMAHGYEWLMLGPVIAIGFNFAIIREWRGSIIAPIVAHALHNGTVLGVLITLLHFLK